MLRNWVRSVKEIIAFLYFFISPGVIVGLVLCSAIYWTSPRWAQVIHFPTHEGDKVSAIARCAELLGTTCASKVLVVHDGGVPIPPEGLPEWTPIRVEKRFESGLTAVSSLGPHGNFQYIVRDFTLPERMIFRIVDGVIVRT